MVSSDVEDQIETARLALGGFPDKDVPMRLENFAPVVQHDCLASPDDAAARLAGWLGELSISQEVTQEQAQKFLLSLKQAVFTSSAMNKYCETYDLTIRIMIEPKMRARQLHDAIAQAWTEFFHLYKIAWRIYEPPAVRSKTVDPRGRRVGSARSRA